MNKRQLDTDVLVIGGGISGLATAWWLNHCGVQVKLWEKKPYLGGKVQTHSENGYQMEQAASMIMNFRPEVDQFIRLSGLEKYKSARLSPSENKRYLLHQGQLQAVPMSMGKLFRSPLWSTKGKLRLLLEPFISKRDNPQETVSEFVRRRLGDEFLEKAMEPFVAGSLASNPDLAIADYVLPRLSALEKKYGSLTAGMLVHKILGKRTARVTENFSFTDGMATLSKKLSEKMTRAVETEMNVKQIIPLAKNRWEVEAEGPYGDILCRCRHVILSTPAQHAALISKKHLSHLSAALEQIKYAPISIVHLGLANHDIGHPLDSAGFLVPRQARLGINGNLWMSSLFPHRAPAGCSLLSTYLGGARDPQAIHLSASQSIDRVWQALTPILNLSNRTMPKPELARIDKHYHGLPLYQCNYHSIRQVIGNQLKQYPGLHIQANYLDGVSIRDRIAAARQPAMQIAQNLRQESRRSYSFGQHYSESLSSLSS